MEPEIERDGERHPMRRASDWPDSDHDLLLELRKDVQALMRTLNVHVSTLQASQITLRQEHRLILDNHEVRLKIIEDERLRREGASALTNKVLALSFTAGGLLVATAGLVAKMNGWMP